MNILDAIQARKSIRSFKNKEVPREIIENILNISRFAPSGGNTQPWKIYVLSNDQLKQNFSFFGAPVGMLVTVEKEVDLNGWGHVGHFIQNICLSSMEFGLGTCLQESWSMYPETAQKIVKFNESEILWCGIALGYPNEDHVINSYRTPREELKDFAKFL